MNVVSQGIYNYHNNNQDSDLYSSIADRLYFRMGPDSATFPYVTHFLIDEVNSPMFVENYEDILVQFNVFSDSRNSSEVGTVASQVKDLYDDAIITISGWSTIMMHREWARKTWLDIEEAWMYTIQYRMIIEKDR